MAGVLELWAKQIGWRIAKGNVIVEGESDVFYFEHASKIYQNAHGIDPLGEDLSVIAAGSADAGGVDGLNERFRVAHQLAGVDVHPDGATKYRFIGLFDNDEAGRRAFGRGVGLTKHIVGYRDLFLLHPVMPLANGSTPGGLKQQAADLNKDYSQLNWEIEDLVSPEIFRVFEADHPHEISAPKTVAGRTHRNLTWAGKFKLRQYVRDYADITHVQEFIMLIRALRSYLRLRTDHLKLTEIKGPT